MKNIILILSVLLAGCNNDSLQLEQREKPIINKEITAERAFNDSFYQEGTRKLTYFDVAHRENVFAIITNKAENASISNKINQTINFKFGIHTLDEDLTIDLDTKEIIKNSEKTLDTHGKSIKKEYINKTTYISFKAEKDKEIKANAEINAYYDDDTLTNKTVATSFIFLGFENITVANETFEAAKFVSVEDDIKVTYFVKIETGIPAKIIVKIGRKPQLEFWHINTEDI